MTGWWFGTFFIFPYIGNVIIPTDFDIFQRGRSTTNQMTLPLIFSMPSCGHLSVAPGAVQSYPNFPGGLGSTWIPRKS